MKAERRLITFEQLRDLPCPYRSQNVPAHCTHKGYQKLTVMARFCLDETCPIWKLLAKPKGGE